MVSDSEFNLTLFAEEQVWDKEVDLGQNIKSLWTGTSCISNVPGRIYHKPVKNCMKEEFIEEVKAQIMSCGALNELIRITSYNVCYTKLLRHLNHYIKPNLRVELMIPTFQSFLDLN